jgi:hypothetical protein
MSAPNEDDSLMSKDTRHLSSQFGCLLFRLPFGLRLDTYELVLGTQKIHIPKRHNKLYPYRDSKPSEFLSTYNRGHNKSCSFEREVD